MCRAARSRECRTAAGIETCPRRCDGDGRLTRCLSRHRIFAPSDKIRLSRSGEKSSSALRHPTPPECRRASVRLEGHRSCLVLSEYGARSGERSRPERALGEDRPCLCRAVPLLPGLFGSAAWQHARPLGDARQERQPSPIRFATARAAAPGPQPISRTRSPGVNGRASTMSASRGDRSLVIRACSCGLTLVEPTDGRTSALGTT